MTDLKNLLQAGDDVAPEKDVIGGSYSPLATDIYKSTIKAAYTVTSENTGAMALALEYEAGGQKNTTQLWMVSGKAKGNKTYFVDKEGKKQSLPGFLVADSLALLTCAKPIAEIPTEKKVIKLYNSDSKKEEPTEVNMFSDLIGKEVFLAVELQTVDKNVKNSEGNYVPSGETREQNEVVKVFRERDMMTVVEIKAKAEEACFHEVWLEKNKGNVINKAKGTGVGGAAGAPTQAAGATQAKPASKSLFA